jgi:hypothetical protein
LVANEGWGMTPVKAVSRRWRGPKARLYRGHYPAILTYCGRYHATVLRHLCADLQK